MQKIFIISLLVLIFQTGCQREEINKFDVENTPHSEDMQDDGESHTAQDDGPMVEIEAACRKANSAQLAQVNLGLTKLNKFLTKCYAETGSKKWCDQVARPNPDSYSTFKCTYSATQKPNFIHPDEKTWPHAIQAVKLVRELVALGIGVDIIYNWWRPEPYNANVGGAAGRHPFGTSVDVRFTSKTQQNRAHTQLCKWRKAGRLRALGYYAGTGLHFGIADKTANTWGKACL